MKPRIALVCAVVCTLVLIFTVNLSAQDFRGGVAGTVTDSSGGLLPGVTITVKNVETNVSANAVSDGRGFYQVRYLNSGTYSVEAQLEGFRPVLRKGITVRVGDSVRIDFKANSVSSSARSLMGVLQGADVAPTTQTVAAVEDVRRSLAAVMKRWSAVEAEADRINVRLKAENLPEIKKSLAQGCAQDGGRRRLGGVWRVACRGDARLIAGH